MIKPSDLLYALVHVIRFTVLHLTVFSNVLCNFTADWV